MWSGAAPKRNTVMAVVAGSILTMSTFFMSPPYGGQKRRVAQGFALAVIDPVSSAGEGLTGERGQILGRWAHPCRRRSANRRLHPHAIPPKPHILPSHPSSNTPLC